MKKIMIKPKPQEKKASKMNQTNSTKKDQAKGK
jgi:hypothetical protein